MAEPSSDWTAVTQLQRSRWREAGSAVAASVGASLVVWTCIIAVSAVII